MTGPGPQWHVAECLLPGLSRATAEALGRRVRHEIAGPSGSQVTYLGSLLMPEDEVLMCLFAGPEAPGGMARLAADLAAAAGLAA